MVCLCQVHCNTAQLDDLCVTKEAQMIFELYFFITLKRVSIKISLFSYYSKVSLLDSILISNFWLILVLENARVVCIILSTSCLSLVHGSAFCC